RKNEIETRNQNLVQTFKSQLLQHLELLHSSVVDSFSQQRQQLKNMKEQLVASVSTKNQICTRVRNMRETSVNKAHELQGGMVNMQDITSNSQNKCNLYMKQAKNYYLENMSSVEAGHRSIEEILRDCTMRTTTVGIHWKNTQVYLQQKGKSNVEAVDHMV
ncbi:hypothetical protein KI387_019444, partial [Taxus chinensis]